MNQSLPTRAFRGHTDLNQLKRQAKELLEAFRGGESATAAEVHAHYRGADAGTFTLHEAQLVLARAYGFASWPKLKAYVDGITAKHLVEAVRRIDFVKLLLERGADPVESDAEPWATPSAWAQKMKHEDVLEVLQKHGHQP